jgi:hypothetical protein
MFSIAKIRLGMKISIALIATVALAENPQVNLKNPVPDHCGVIAGMLNGPDDSPTLAKAAFEVLGQMSVNGSTFEASTGEQISLKNYLTSDVSQAGVNVIHGTSGIHVVDGTFIEIAIGSQAMSATGSTAANASQSQRVFACRFNPTFDTTKTPCSIIAGQFSNCIEEKQPAQTMGQRQEQANEQAAAQSAWIQQKIQTISSDVTGEINSIK